MSEIENLIGRLDTARAEMQALLAEIDRERELYPTWTIKQVLAHLTGWDEAITTSLRAHVVGNEPGTPAARGIDHYNAQSVEERQALGYEHVVKEWELAREKLKQTLREMPLEKFQATLLAPWGATGTVTQLVEVFIDHEIEHAEEIRQIIADTPGE